MLCRLAATNIRSHAPIGFGPEYHQRATSLERQLQSIPDEFRRLVSLARRRHGWAKR